MNTKQIFLAILAVGNAQALTLRAASCAAVACVESCQASGAPGGACLPSGECVCAGNFPALSCEVVQCSTSCHNSGAPGGVCLHQSEEKPQGECVCAKPFGGFQKRACDRDTCGRGCARHSLFGVCNAQGICVCQRP